MAAGNDRAAVRKLKDEKGLTIPRETLRDWKVSKADAYRDIRHRLEQKRREEMRQILGRDLLRFEVADELVDGDVVEGTAVELPEPEQSS